MRDKRPIRPLVSRRAALIIWAVLIVALGAAVWWVENGGPTLGLAVIAYLVGYFFAQAGPRQGPSSD